MQLYDFQLQLCYPSKVTEVKITILIFSVAVSATIIHIAICEHSFRQVILAIKFEIAKFFCIGIFLEGIRSRPYNECAY